VSVHQIIGGAAGGAAAGYLVAGWRGSVALSATVAGLVWWLTRETDAPGGRVAQRSASQAPSPNMQAPRVQANPWTLTPEPIAQAPRPTIILRVPMDHAPGDAERWLRERGIFYITESLPSQRRVEMVVNGRSLGSNPSEWEFYLRSDYGIP